MWFFSVKSSAVSLMTLLSLQVCIAQISAVGTIFFDMETECFAPLLEADIDGNLKLNRMEYVKFIQLESQNELFQGGSLVHLPDQFSLQFNRLICFFGNDGEEFDGEDCLDDLPLDGADGEPTPDENVFLYEVCHQTKKAIYDTLNPQLALSYARTEQRYLAALDYCCSGGLLLCVGHLTRHRSSCS